jgi:hypothetical protein
MSSLGFVFRKNSGVIVQRYCFKNSNVSIILKFSLECTSQPYRPSIYSAVLGFFGWGKFQVFPLIGFNPIIPQFDPSVPRFNPDVPQFDPIIPQFDPDVPRFDPGVPH